ncbi:MAG: histidine kinase [Nibricoccus sp.]
MKPGSPSTTETEESAKRFSPLVRFLILTAIWLGVSAVFALQASAFGFATWTRALTFTLLDWGPWIIFSPFVLWLAERLPISHKTWRWALPVHLLACVVVVATIEASMYGLHLRREVFRGPRPGRPMMIIQADHSSDTPTARPEPLREQEGPREFGGPRDPNGPGGPEGRGMGDRPPLPPNFVWFRLVDRARFAVPIYWMLVAIAHALAHQRRSADRERRALRAEALVAETRLMVLQAQLNPHFLFNTLNTITQLIYDNPEGAEEMITSLSELLRAVLAAQSRREVTLDEEIELLERYFAIQKVRFADRLNVVYEIDSSAANIAVPTLILQPLAENAIKHGITPDRTPGTVFVRARTKNLNTLCIEIADTGGQPGGAPDQAGQPLKYQEGVGLANTRARLETLYPGRHVFALERAAEGGVLIRIEIPLRRISA